MCLQSCHLCLIRLLAWTHTQKSIFPLNFLASQVGHQIDIFALLEKKVNWFWHGKIHLHIHQMKSAVNKRWVFMTTYGSRWIGIIGLYSKHERKFWMEWNRQYLKFGRIYFEKALWIYLANFTNDEFKESFDKESSETKMLLYVSLKLSSSKKHTQF